MNVLEWKIRTSNSDVKSLSEIEHEKENGFDFSNQLSELPLSVEEKGVPGMPTSQNHQFSHEI